MKKEMIILIILIAIILFIVYLYLENNIVIIRNYNVKSNKLPDSFEGYKIAHISDFHNTKSNLKQKKILNSLHEDKPDILVITGDLIDSRRTNMEVSLKFIEKIKDITIYYVAGNHESRIEEYDSFKEKLIKLGVIVLENEKVKLNKNGKTINLVGLQDPAFETGEKNHDQMIEVVDKYLKKLTNKDNFEILLIHRPELFDIYVKNNADLVFSGHAHGGQIVIPFVGPVIAPNQGFFPKLTSGVHTKKNTNLIISTGVGNSLCPVRINNNPELVYVTLNKKIT